MMKNKLMTILLVVTLLFGIAGIASATNGPKADDLWMSIFESDVAEYAAFEAGAIDIIDWSLDPALVAQYSTAPDNASIILGFYAEMGMFQFDINNNETIPSNPGYSQPTYDPWFRSAIQYCVDKDYIVTTICQGLAERIDSPVPPALGDWYCNDVQHYGYSPSEAEAILDAHGYTMGTTYRINPTTGLDMEPLEFYMRADDMLRRTPAGQAFAAELEAIGIPVNSHVVDKSVCYDYVMVYYDFNLYTGGWSLGRDPDHLMWLWVSWMGPGMSPPIEWALNYAYINDAELDTYFEGLGYAPDLVVGKDQAYKAQKRMMNRPDDTFPGISCIIPLWSTAGYLAYRRPLVNCVNGKGDGLVNWWTFMRGRFEGSEIGGSITWGFKSDVNKLNPLYSSWVWDWYVLDKIYDGMIAVSPYNVAMDLPWMAEDWTVGTWDNGGEECTMMTFTLRDDMLWHDGTPVTVHDVKFTYEYIQNATDCWIWSNVADIDHIVVDPGTNKVYVYEGILSVWSFHWVAGCPILPKHIWELIVDPHGFAPEPTLIGSGPWKFVEHVPGSHAHLEANRAFFLEVQPSADVNVDFVVDIFDIVHVAASFGLSRGQTGYDITADVVSEWDLIDIFDLVIIASNFGYEWYQ